MTSREGYGKRKSREMGVGAARLSATRGSALTPLTSRQTAPVVIRDRNRMHGCGSCGALSGHALVKVGVFHALKHKHRLWSQLSIKLKRETNKLLYKEAITALDC